MVDVERGKESFMEGRWKKSLAFGSSVWLFCAIVMCGCSVRLFCFLARRHAECVENTSPYPVSCNLYPLIVTSREKVFAQHLS